MIQTKTTTPELDQRSKTTATNRSRGRESFRAVWRKQWMLYAMLAPALILLLLFNFYPLWGISIAFVDFRPTRGVSGSEFVGLENFARMFAMRDAFPIFRNTVLIAVGKIVFGQVMALAFALMAHEISSTRFRRTIQTLTSLPHFLSWVIIGGIMAQILSNTGMVNTALQGLGLTPVRFLGDVRVFPWTLILSETWKEFGFSAIIYFAALTQISPDLYEAAAVDGAGRSAQLRHITLPGVAPIIVLLSCLSLGNILNAGFEQVLVLINPAVTATGEIIDTWVYRNGLIGSNYSLGTAVGLFRSVIAFILILLSYWLADRFANYRVF